MPKGTVDTLLKPENKKVLTGILTYHVVPGKMDGASMTKAINDGKGKATFKTVAGGTLTARLEGKDIILTDLYSSVQFRSLLLSRMKNSGNENEMPQLLTFFGLLWWTIWWKKKTGTV